MLFLFQCPYVRKPGGCRNKRCLFFHPESGPSGNPRRVRRSPSKDFKRVKTSDGEFKEVHLFPDNLIPFIFGKKGSTLKEIRSRCRAYIHVTPAGALVDGDKREVTLRGDEESISQAKEEIDATLKSVGIDYENFKEEFSVPVECKERLCAEDNHGFSQIDRIMSKSGAEISISPCASNEALIDVCLCGELSSIKEAKEEISQVLGDDIHYESQPTPPRETTHLASEGGFKRTRAQDGDFVEVHRFPADRMGLIVGKKGSTVNEIQSVSGVQLSIAGQEAIVDGDKREVTMKGDERSISLAKGKIDSLFRGKGVIFDQFKEIISVPVESVDDLFGGGHIDKIQSETGATINLQSNLSACPFLDYLLIGELYNIRKAREDIERSLRVIASSRLRNSQSRLSASEDEYMGSPDRRQERGTKRSFEGGSSYENNPSNLNPEGNKHR